MELVQIYLILLNTITITTNFLGVFPQIFSSWIRIRILNADPGGKLNADRDPQPCLKHSWVTFDAADGQIHSQALSSI